MKLLSKKNEELFFKILMKFTSAVVLLIILSILFTIIKKGFPYISFQMLTEKPVGGFYFGGEGGILNAIVGSLYLAFGASILALFISLPVALFINVHLKRYKSFVSFIRILVDISWGIPSIVYGTFAFSIMLYFGLRMSLLLGIITVAALIIPIMIRSMDEVFKTVPNELMEAGLSLGSTFSDVAFKIYLKQCIPGVITAIMLAFGRAIGDAAAVLFTTGFTDNIPTSLHQPAATLPLSIFFQLSSPIEAVQNRAYASAVVLMTIIIIVSLLGRYISKRMNKNKI